MNSGTHHEITISADLLRWWCSCTLRGKAMNPRYTQQNAIEHVFRPGETKSVRRGEK